MHISVKHITRYSYADVASYSIQSLRLTPPSFDGQRVLEWAVTGRPGNEMTPATDGFGNVLHLMTVNAPHDTLEIQAAGIVDVENRNGLVLGLNDPVPLRVYLKETALTAPNRAIKALIAASGDSDTVGRLHALMAAIRDKVDYLPGSTSAVTTAAEALEAGKGVCQDHAHIFIAAARHAGIPARYVTGYLLTDGVSTEAAHHAWAETWVEGLGWVGFDVANRLCPTDSYIRMAAGLDAHYAAPVRGSRRGGASETLEVQVVVQQQTMQQQ
jgi:transglutaminase-like putative cysteine protease